MDMNSTTSNPISIRADKAHKTTRRLCLGLAAGLLWGAATMVAAMASNLISSKPSTKRSILAWFSRQSCAARA